MAQPTTEQSTLEAPTPLLESGRPDSMAASLASVSNTPLPFVNDLGPPRASYLQPNLEDSVHTTPRESFLASNSGPLIPESEKPEAYGDSAPEDPDASRRSPLRSRRLLWLALLGGLVLLIVVVVVPVYFTVIKPKHNVNGSVSGGAGGSPGSGPTKGGGNPQSPNGAITGGDGSTVILADGTSFTYKNQFGGFCEWSLLSKHSKQPRLSLRTRSECTWTRPSFRGCSICMMAYRRDSHIPCGHSPHVIRHLGSVPMCNLS
jgi:hypothetical protein